MSREIIEAVGVLEREKGISSDRLMSALEDALLSAYKKSPGSAKYARVDMDRGSGDFRVFELLVPDDLEERLLADVEPEEPVVDPETGELTEPPEPEIDPEVLAEYRDQIEERDVTPEGFGRIAAQTAKQVILQRIREAERDMMFEEYRDRVGELITGIVQQTDSRYTLVQLRERVEALLPKSEQIHQERYDHGQRLKAVITEVSAQAKGPSIIVSRRSPELIKKLFELEVPEIADGLVEITGVAREPGYRSKIAVVSHASGVDPVGACVGPRGSRVRMVVSELRGEKIDIIPFNEEPARFIAKALSPARVREVLVDDDAQQATVIVPDDQLSLAIGREGLNARLAARLTGWRIDIRSETEFAEEEADMDYAEEEVSGRCAAILANGRRCPNAALSGSRYCGLPAHQALADKGTDYVAGEPEPGEAGGPSAEEPDTPAAEAEAAADETQAALEDETGATVADPEAESELDLDPADQPPSTADEEAIPGLEEDAHVELPDGAPTADASVSEPEPAAARAEGAPTADPGDSADLSSADQSLPASEDAPAAVAEDTDPEAGVGEATTPEPADSVAPAEAGSTDSGAAAGEPGAVREQQ